MNCEINFNTDIPTVKTYPKLFRELLLHTDMDVQTAVQLYGLTLTEDFKALNIKEPTLEIVLGLNDLINQTEADFINKQDRQDLLDMSLNKTPESFKDSYINAFTVDGIFGINTEVLVETGLFTDAEVEDLVGNQTLLNKYRELYYKLLSTEEDFPSITAEFNINTPEGKLNPDKYRSFVYDNYIGLTTTKEIFEKAQLINDEIVLEQPHVVDTILEVIKNKQQLVSYETDEFDGSVTKKTINNTKTTLEQTLDLQESYLELNAQINYLRQLPVEDYVDSKPLVEQFLKNIEKQAKLIGFDLNNLSEKSAQKTYDEMQSFLDATYNFLVDVHNQDTDSLQESLSDYANTYNTFFDIKPVERKATTNNLPKSGVYLHLETHLSEEELYKTYNLIKVKRNIYQKVADMAIENILELLSSVSMAASTNLLSKYKSKYVTPTSEDNTIEKIILYKEVLGIPQEETKKINMSYNRVITTNPSNFVVDFNKRILSNPILKDIFYYSNRGLEAQIDLGGYTLKQLENELPKTVFKSLQEYALISGNESLSPLAEMLQEGEVTLNTDALRNFYVNNPSNLEEFKGEYNIVGTAIAAVSNEPFIKVKGEVYEQVSENNYEKVEFNPRYNNFGLEQPIQSVEDISKHIPQTPIVEKAEVRTTNLDNNNEIEFC